MSVFISAGLAFFITTLSIALLIPCASRLGLLETPGGHRGHDAPTPMVGGVAIFLGLLVGVTALNEWGMATFLYLCGATVLVVIGYLDDRHLIPIGIKAAGQIFAAVLLCIGGQVVIRNMGNLLGFGDIHLGWFAWPFSVFAIVGLINAINMLDGMDGMAGSVSLAIAIALGWAAYANGDAMLGSIVVFAATIAAFLCFNLRVGNRSARTFMGDTGSMIVGYTIAWFVIALSQRPGVAMEPMSVLWVLIVPVLDTFRLMALRVMRRKSPFAPDTTHLHHILKNRGLSTNQVVVLASAATLFFAGVAILISSLGNSTPILFYGFVGLFLVYMAYTRRFLRRYVREPRPREDRRVPVDAANQ